MEGELKDINMKLLNLWKNTPSRYLNGLMPFFLDLDAIEKHAVTFIGLNPSFSESGFEKGLRGSDHDGIDIRSFYSYPQSKGFDLEQALGIERTMRMNYPYFKPFRDLLKDTGHAMAHLDLFFVRETSQEVVKKVIIEKSGKLTSFGQSQMNILTAVLDEIEPKAIVVVNALASQIYKQEKGLRFDEDHGCYFTQVSGRNVPTFLSSMLSGQRALDIFSRERLGWHLRKVIKVFR